MDQQWVNLDGFGIIIDELDLRFYTVAKSQLYKEENNERYIRLDYFYEFLKLDRGTHVPVDVEKFMFKIVDNPIVFDLYVTTYKDQIIDISNSNYSFDAMCTTYAFKSNDKNMWRTYFNKIDLSTEIPKAQIMIINAICMHSVDDLNLDILIQIESYIDYKSMFLHIDWVQDNFRRKKSYSCNIIGSLIENNNLKMLKHFVSKCINRTCIPHNFFKSVLDNNFEAADILFEYLDKPLILNQSTIMVHSCYDTPYFFVSELRNSTIDSIEYLLELYRLDMIYFDDIFLKEFIKGLVGVKNVDVCLYLLHYFPLEVDNLGYLVDLKLLKGIEKKLDKIRRINKELSE